jgi:hypothetical protein
MTITTDTNTQAEPMNKEGFMNELFKVGEYIISERNLTRNQRKQALKIVHAVAHENITPEVWTTILEGNLPRQEVAFDLFAQNCEEQLDNAISLYRR